MKIANRTPVVLELSHRCTLLSTNASVKPTSHTELTHKGLHSVERVARYIQCNETAEAGLQL